jgi:hypothetical protein
MEVVMLKSLHLSVSALQHVPNSVNDRGFSGVIFANQRGHAFL